MLKAVSANPSNGLTNTQTRYPIHADIGHAVWTGKQKGSAMRCLFADTSRRAAT